MVPGRENGGEGRDSKGGTDQERKDGAFVRNGLLHFDYKNSNSSITVAVVAFFIFSGGVVLTAYIVGSSKIEQVVYSTASDAKLDKDFTIREKFKSVDEYFINNNRDIQECRAMTEKVNTMWYAFTSPSSPKGKR